MLKIKGSSAFFAYRRQTATGIYCGNDPVNLVDAWGLCGDKDNLWGDVSLASSIAGLAIYSTDAWLALGGKIGQFKIGDLARVSAGFKLIGRGFAGLSIVADIKNSNLSNERKIVNSTFNLMSMTPNPIVSSAGITLNVINVIAGDEIEHGVREIDRWSNYYNANPYKIIRDFGY